MSLELYLTSCNCRVLIVSFFFFNDPATTEIYTLSLHDALPIWSGSSSPAATITSSRDSSRPGPTRSPSRSEEHTSELQSQSNLVCRLLLEKKKKIHYLTEIKRNLIDRNDLLRDIPPLSLTVLRV